MAKHWSYLIVIVYLAMLGQKSLSITDEVEGVLYRIILKRKLSEIQWAAFILFCAGYNLIPILTRCCKLPFKVGRWQLMANYNEIMALLSGFAGVYTEAIIKKGPSRNINVQNFWLYVFGVAFNAVAEVVQEFDAVMNKMEAVSQGV